MIFELDPKVLSSPVVSKNLYLLVQFIIYFILILLELSKSIKLMFNQLTITISTKIIRKSNVVVFNVPCGGSVGSTHIYLRSNNPTPLSQVLRNGNLIIFANKRESHTSSDFRLNDSKTPSDWSLAMFFLIMWPKRQCYKHDLSKIFEESIF